MYAMARAFGHAHRNAITLEVDQLADEDFHIAALTGGIPERAGHGIHAPDIAVMIRAEHIDGMICPAVPLIEVVGDITGEVGGFPIRFDDNAILIITEIGGAQPHRIVFFVNNTAFAQFFNGCGNRSGIVKGLFVEEHIKFGPEICQGVLDLREHELNAPGAEHFLRFDFREGARIGMASS